MTDQKRSPIPVLISALRVLARDIESRDGVANAVIAEAAEVIEELANALDEIRDSVLHERFQLAGLQLGPDIVNAILGIIDDHDPRPLPEEAQ